MDFVKRLPAALVLLLTMSLHAGVPAAARVCSEDYLLCGPASLSWVCRFLGVDATTEELATLAEYRQESGASLLGLLKAARAKGLAAVAVKASLEELASLKVPVIVHLWGAHFMVIQAEKDGMLRLIEPPAAPRLVKLDVFQKSFTGFALVVAKDVADLPTGQPSGPDLRMDSYEWDFGLPYQGEKVAHELRFRNVGDKDLTLSKVESSCDCIVPISWPEKIAPGGEASIKVVYDTAGQRARQSNKAVIIHSNDPITPDVYVIVQGYVRSLRVQTSPGSFDFGSTRQGDAAVRMVHLTGYPEEPVMIKSVTSDNPHVNVVVSTSDEKERPGYFLHATLKPGTPAGELRGSVIVESDHTKEPKTIIPVAALVRGDIEPSRDSLFFGILKAGAGARQQIDLRSFAQRAFKINSVASSLPCLRVEAEPLPGGKQWRITGELLDNAPAGYLSTHIAISTDNQDQPVIELPVSALIEGS